MACNCGGGRNTRQGEYVWTNPVTGVQQSFRTEMEARAAAARGGGGAIRFEAKVSAPG
jgi:hypothetical protein